MCQNLDNLNPEQIKELEELYTTLHTGKQTPHIIFTAFGAFFSSGEVKDFDDEGNFYDLTEEEQKERQQLYFNYINNPKERTNDSGAK